MARITPIERELKIATAGLEPPAIAALLAQTAREALAESISDGTGSPDYDKFVNGRQGLPEESVIPPGPILYLFSAMEEVAAYALAFCVARSPVRSGRYKASWFVLANGAPTDPNNIPHGAEVIVTNDRPYARKIDVGHMKMSVPSGIIESARQAVNRRFGNFVFAQRRMITLAGGYVLKGRFRRGASGTGRRKLAKDTQAGAQLTYPALVLSVRQ